jgi:hypothetical protein
MTYNPYPPGSTEAETFARGFELGLAGVADPDDSVELTELNLAHTIRKK